MSDSPEWDRRRFLRTSGLAAGGAAAATVLTAPAAVGAPLPAGGELPTGRASATNGAAGMAAEPARTVPVAPGAGGGWYSPNRAPLAPAAFLRLPPTAVTPGGWVRGQLDLQLNGLGGRMDEISDYLVYENCGWVDPAKDAWEELPYWLRGFADLGLVTGDQRVSTLTRKWVDGILATQQADGWFGPARHRTSLEGGPDFWPSMPLLDMLRNHAEATGDPRIEPFLTRFFGFMSKQDDAVFGRSWGSFRWGDNIDGIYWLYNRTGEQALLDLVRRIHAHSADYVNDIPTWHNVNLAQGFREPAQYGVLAGGKTLEQATYQLYETVMDRYGQFAGGGFAGDENSRPGFGDPRQGFETCGIVELMRSCEILTRITGDPVWADRCEQLALNLLPAAFDPQQKGVHYVTSANSIALENVGKSPEFQNGFAMQPFRPGLHIYRCCPHNYGQGWPYYAEEMWLGTPDLGLCASIYGPSEVTAKVSADGVSATITEETDYPFGETITLTVKVPAATSFPLWLRIPGWAERARVTVNQRAVAGRPAGGTYLVVDRSWHDGDTVRLELPMTTRLRTWEGNHDSVTVSRGPLDYSLAIGEQYRTFVGGQDSIDDPDWPQYEVLPTSDWNYGLDIDPAHVQRSFDVIAGHGPVPENPFTADDVPVRLRTKVRRIPQWRADEKNVIRPLQDSPARSGQPSERATLIPMGAARLRVTSFPLIARRGGHEWAAPSASHVFGGDLLDAVNDGLEPASSYETTMPRLTFWDHKGSTEWVQYDYASPISASSSKVYFYDDTGHGECRIPASWRLLFLRNGVWIPVGNPSGFPVAADRWNEVRFDRINTTGIRLELLLQQDFSAGILEWAVPQLPG